MPPIRVLLADDHTVVREGLRHLLEGAHSGCQVIGTAGDGRELVAEAGRLCPDMVVLDIGMPLLNGIEAARQIRQVAPTAKMVFLTQQSGRDYVSGAFAVGAMAYVLKNAAADELLTAIHEAVAGRYYVSSQLRQQIPAALLMPNQNPGALFNGSLTPRQREVLQLVAEGKTAKEMAHVLQISVKTVEFHKAGIMEELGLRTTAELTRYALENGILAT